jgi:hypothetical protein
VAITSGAVTAGTAVATLCPVPPGPCTVLIANSGTASTVYVGPGTNLTAQNGFPVQSGALAPTVIPVYPGSAGVTLSVFCSAGTASVAWLVTDPSGGTGRGTLG